MDARYKLRCARTLLVLLLALMSCEHPDPLAGTDPGAVRLGGATPRLDQHCGNEVDLVLGSELEVVGKVMAELRDGTIRVSYETRNEWYITETCLHFFSDDEDFLDVPLQRGNAMLSQFEYSRTHHFLSNYSCEVDNRVPVLDHLFVTAHAVVARQIGESCVDLVEMEESLPRDSVLVDLQYTRTESLFALTLSNAGSFSGEYLAWCMDNNGRSAEYPYAHIVSSYAEDPEVLASVTDSPHNLDVLNYMLNTWFRKASFPAIQASIWSIMNGEFNNPSGGINLDEDQMSEFDMIMEDIRDNGEGFRPDCDDYVVLILASPDKQEWQNVCFLAKRDSYPVYQYETAWGFGSRFPGTDCSMYFTACAQTDM